jgi:hypothetical protein
LAILKRRSRMISFRLSEEEYAGLRTLCEIEGARSVSDLARDAVSRLMRKESGTQIEIVLRTLEGRMDNLDLQVQRLSAAVGQAPTQVLRQTNGKA